eukprot:SAG22_NODE_2566_length_2434_cov_1.406852_6_plen_104_part_00
MLAVPSKENVVYNFKVGYDSKNASGAFWTGTLTSTETMSDGVTNATTTQKVGTLYYPHLPNMVGFGHFKIQSDGNPRPRHTRAGPSARCAARRACLSSALPVD